MPRLALTPFAPPDFFLPPGWDANWKMQRALASSQVVTIHCFGDSIGAGSGASDPMKTAWFPLLRAGLIAKYGPAYADYYSQYGASPIGLVTGGALPAPPVTRPTGEAPYCE